MSAGKEKISSNPGVYQGQRPSSYTRRDLKIKTTEHNNTNNGPKQKALKKSNQFK